MPYAKSATAADSCKKDEEERLREKLKQRKARKTSDADANAPPASASASDKPSVNTTSTEKQDKQKDQDKGHSNANGSANDNGSESGNGHGQGNSKRAKSRQRRRRRERRQETRRVNRNPPGGPGGYPPHGHGGGGGPPMDNRAYYSQDHYGGGHGYGGRYDRGRDGYGPRDGYGQHGHGPRDGYGNFGGRGGGGGSPPRREWGGRMDNHRPYDRYGRGGRGGGGDDRMWNSYRGGASRRDAHGRAARRSRSRSFSRSRSRSRDSGRSFSRSRSRNRDRLSKSKSRSRDRDRDRSSKSKSKSRSYSRSSSRSRDRDRDRDRSRSRSHSDDDFSRRSRSASRSRSVSRSGSRSRSASVSNSRSASRSKSKSKSSRDRDRDPKSRSRSPSADTPRNVEQIQQDEATKDQRTIFVSQLVMKANESDIRRYFRKKLGFKVNDVILLKDKRSGRHKGCAYVELARLEDVVPSLAANGKIPDFQRFPILLKASESEKNAPIVTSGQRVEAQKVYVGNVDQNVTQSQLYAIFSQFGQLDRVLLQVDIATGMSKGFAFLSYQDAKVSNLSIVAMSGQLLAGKPMKTGWANQNSASSGLQEIQSKEFPDGAFDRIEKANVVFKQLNGSGLAQTAGILLIPGMASQILGLQALSPDAKTAQIATIAEEAVNLALGLAPSATPSTNQLPMPLPKIDFDNPKHVKGELSRHILVRNMFNKDEETEENWADDIKLDFEEEGGKHGKILKVKVMSEEAGGKIYASFESEEGAAACGENFAGRWFDKRQLTVEFVNDAIISS